MVADLEIGARREEIVNQLYRSRSLNVLKLWGRVLARLTNGMDGALVWSILSITDFNKTKTNENDLSEVIDELIINIPQAKIVILIYESKEKDKKFTNALVYSIKNISSLNLVQKWKPIGTKNLAKIKLEKNVAEAEKEIIDYVKDNLSKITI